MRASTTALAAIGLLLFAAGCTTAHGPETRHESAVLARALFERGETRAAQRRLEALARDSRDPVTWTNVGIARFRRDKPDAAEMAWKKALELDPRHARAHYWLGALARDRAREARQEGATEAATAQFEAAVRALESAANADPASAAIQDVLAAAYTDVHRDADAARARDESRRLDPAGVAVALGAAELEAIVLPPQPHAGSGRLPLVFRAEPLAWRATGVAANDVDGDGRTDLVLEGTAVALRADSIAGGAVQFTERALGDIGRVTIAARLLADGDDRIDLLLCTEPVPETAAETVPTGDVEAMPRVEKKAKPRRTEAPPAAPPTGIWLLRGGAAGPDRIGDVEGAVRALSIADLDRDGDSDVVAATSVPPGVRLWRNDGGGRFDLAAPPVPGLDAVGPLRQALAADLNGDHRSDLVTADVAGKLRIFVQGPSGTFVEVTRASGLAAERARAVDAADVDADGQLDLLCGNDAGLWVFANRGDLRFRREAAYRAPQTAYAHGPRSSIGVAAFVRLDFDNDGGQDVLTLHPHAAAAPPLAIADAEAPPSRTVAGAATPVAEDAAPELPLPVRPEPATLALWRATGRGVMQGLDDRFEAAHVLSGNVAAADFDLDGDLDVACVRPDSVVVVHWNEGGNANRRLLVELAGERGARSAVGARLELYAGDLVRVADVVVSPLWLGARDVERLQLVRVAWPDGRVENWMDVALPADGRLRFAAGSARR